MQQLSNIDRRQNRVNCIQSCVLIIIIFLILAMFLMGVALSDQLKEASKPVFRGWSAMTDPDKYAADQQKEGKGDQADLNSLDSSASVDEFTYEEAVKLYEVDLEKSDFTSGPCMYEGQVEPNCHELRGVIYLANPFDQWIDGYRRNAGLVRDGYEQMERASQISIPPNFDSDSGGFVEVAILRPLAPQQGIQELRGDSEEQWSLEEALELFGIDQNKVVANHHGLQSWELSPAVKGGTFTVNNICKNNWLDGYTVYPNDTIQPEFKEHPEGSHIGIPPGKTKVVVTMATLRPCE